jgi:hypothetical protein
MILPEETHCWVPRIIIAALHSAEAPKPAPVLKLSNLARFFLTALVYPFFKTNHIVRTDSPNACMLNPAATTIRAGFGEITGCKINENIFAR